MRVDTTSEQQYIAMPIVRDVLNFSKIAKALLLLPLICVLFSTESFASHYRYGNMSWVPGTGNNITFTVREAWRWSSFSNPAIGTTVNTGTLRFGDGGSASVNLVVTSINPGDDWFFGQTTITYNYPATGNYTAYIEGCCRISTLQNNADGSYRNETFVNVGTGNSSPVIQSVVILNMQVGQNPATYQFPAIDPNGDNLQIRLANSSEFAGGTHPSGLSVSSTGLLSFNTVGTTIGNLFSTAVAVEDLDANNNIKSKVMVDLIIKIVGNSTPPTFNAPTPCRWLGAVRRVRTNRDFRRKCQPQRQCDLERRKCATGVHIYAHFAAYGQPGHYGLQLDPR